MVLHKFGSTTANRDFNDSDIEAVWQKGIVVPGIDPRVRRKDSCGAWIDRNAYGETVENGYGWEIDHIKPIAKGGGDELGNLQPLQWENNRHKGDQYPGKFCKVTSR